MANRSAGGELVAMGGLNHLTLAFHLSERVAEGFRTDTHKDGETERYFGLDVLRCVPNDGVRCKIASRAVAATRWRLDVLFYICVKRSWEQNGPNTGDVARRSGKMLLGALSGI